MCELLWSFRLFGIEVAWTKELLFYGVYYCPEDYIFQFRHLRFWNYKKYYE